MRSLLLLASILFLSAVTFAQCAQTSKVHITNTKDGRIINDQAIVELTTGYTMYGRTGDRMYNSNNGKTIYAIIRLPNKNVVCKVKVGQGMELVYCGAKPCEVNCDMMPNTFNIVDGQGNRGTVTRITY